MDSSADCLGMECYLTTVASVIPPTESSGNACRYTFWVFGLTVLLIL